MSFSGHRGLRACAVIVAGGRGSRMNLDINKQYIDICGRPLLSWTIQAFEDCEVISDIILVTPAEEIIFCKREIVDAFGFTKVKSIVAGGPERQNSVYNGLMELDEECGIVLVHDGARPFVTGELIADVAREAAEYGAVTAAVPVKDTIKAADEEGFVTGTLDRNTLWAVQTPQAFDAALLKEAHKKAAEEGFTGTDDAVLVERMGKKLKIVMGSYENIKLTTPEDIAVAEAIAASRLGRRFR